MNARDYLTLLRESKLTILGAVLACLVVAGAATLLMSPTYSSTASFYVTTGTTTLGQQNPASDMYQGAQLAKDRVKSYTELVQGPRVADDAARLLGGTTSASSLQGRISATSSEDTVTFAVAVTDSSPSAANQDMTAVADALTSLVRKLETPPNENAPQVDIQVVQPPTVPVTPESPKPVINLIVGLLVGLAIGFGIAIFRRSSDVAIRSADDLEYAADTTVLGVVPERAGGQPVVVPVSGAGSEAEAFRRVRTNVEFANVSHGRRVLVVTSAVPGEGRTTAICNLASALTAVGARVVVVDADLRRPGLLSLLGLESAFGLTAVVEGAVPLDRALITGAAGGFDVLGGGGAPDRPNELLSSRRTRALVSELRDRYDYVLIDAPPLLTVADAVNLGTHADGAVLVCRWARTTAPEVHTAVSHLRAVSVAVVGAILIAAPARAGARHARQAPDSRPVGPTVGTPMAVRTARPAGVPAARPRPIVRPTPADAVRPSDARPRPGTPQPQPEPALVGTGAPGANGHRAGNIASAPPDGESPSEQTMRLTPEVRSVPRSSPAPPAEADKGPDTDHPASSSD